MWSSRVVSTRITEVLTRPLRVRVVTLNWTSRATVSGRRGAAGSPASRRRLLSIPLDSRRRTSSEPSGRGLSVLNGTDLTPFLTRQHRCAPAAENRIHRSMEKKPRSARFSMPSRSVPASSSTRAFSPSW